MHVRVAMLKECLGAGSTQPRMHLMPAEVTPKDDGVY